MDHVCFFGQRGGVMVSVLDYGASVPDSRPGGGHCIVFFGKTLNPHTARGSTQVYK